MSYRMQSGGRPEITKAGVSKVSGVVNVLVLRNLSAFRYPLHLHASVSKGCEIGERLKGHVCQQVKLATIVMQSNKQI